MNSTHLSPPTVSISNAPSDRPRRAAAASPTSSQHEPSSSSTLAPAADSSSSSANTLIAAGCYADALYQAVLPAWRWRIRKILISALEAEVPHLADLQSRTRHPILDTIFHFTSFFGTHSSFLLFLPQLCWFGLPHFAFQFVFVLSLGVFLSSALKDALCVPRPYSPPVQRLTLVSSHAREYGFPSTHSTNAVGLALILLPYFGTKGKALVTLYAATIVAGRIYTGMHSVTDCVGGIALALAQHLVLGPCFRGLFSYAQNPHWSTPWVLTTATLFLITVHPQPVDPCPCFEDGVAFMSVTLGILLGHWLVASTHTGWSIPLTTNAATLPALLGLSIAKLTLGVAVLLGYRLLAKQLMHLVLPGIIALSNKAGLDFSRRHYLPSHSYEESYAKEEAPLLHPVPSMIHLPDAPPPEENNSGSISGSTLRQRGRPSEKQFNDAASSSIGSEPTVLTRPEGHTYDADVLTKVVCYSGIGFLAAFGIPWIFEQLQWSV